MDELEEKVNSLIKSFTEWQIMINGELKELHSKTTESSVRKAAKKEYAQEAEYLDSLRREAVTLLKEINGNILHITDRG